MLIEFEAEVWQWDAEAHSAWHFVSVPNELSGEIRELPRPARGFGSVRVRARIGASEWTSSIFPHAASGGYALPLSKRVRDAEGLSRGDVALVHLQLEV